MRKAFLILFCVLAATAQSNKVVVCDQQASPKCLTWTAGATLPADLTITGPLLPLTGGTISGPLYFDGGFANALIIKRGSNLVAEPDPAYGQFLGDIAAAPAYSAGTTYSLGQIASSGGTCYTSLQSLNTGHPLSNSSWWTPNCIDDRSRFDWFGMEGDFFRIKGKGLNTTGDYYDWTRFKVDGTALPPHQVDFNDSSWQTLIHIDESAGYDLTAYTFHGSILTTGPSIYSNGALTGVQFKDTGGTPREVLSLAGDNGVYIDNSASGGGNIAIRPAAGTSILLGHGGTTTEYVLPNNGYGSLGSSGVRWPSVYATALDLAAAGTVAWNGQLALRYSGGHLQASDNGSTWTNVLGGGGVPSVTGTINQVLVNGGYGSAVTSAVTLTLPQDIATASIPRFQGLLLNQANDSSGYQLQVNGGVEMTSAAGNILSKGTAANAFYANAGGITATTGYWIGATQIINSSGQWIGASRWPNTAYVTNIDVAGTCTGCVKSISGTVNQVNTSPASPSTGAVTLSLPQDIATASIPRFQGLLLNQANDSSGYQLQSNGGIEQTSSAANILSKGTAANAVYANAGGIAAITGFYVGTNGATQVINSSGYYVGGQVNTAGIVSASTFWISGTYTGQTLTVTLPAGASQNHLYFRGGILVSYD